MKNTEDTIQKLTIKDEKAAFDFYKDLCALSAESNAYVDLIPEFAKMMESKNSFVRTRGFGMICAQARWADKGQIAEVLDKMLLLLADPKPITVRQALAALHELVLYRPELTERIRVAVHEIDLSKYKDSMSPLIKKDMDELLRIIE